jgi:hypothetical protein
MSKARDIANKKPVKFGSTANRPASPAVGQIYYDTTLDDLIEYTSAGWVQISSQIPRTPTIGTATVISTTQVSLSFSQNTQGAVATSFVATSNTGNFTGTGNSSPIIINGSFAAGTSYTFTIIAKNGNGSSSSSGASNSVAPAPVLITGGTLTSDATYYYRTFTSTGNLTVLGNLTADVLVIAGGGAGAYGYAGGGGAGGLLYFPATALTTGSYTATIGAGGTISTSGYNTGGNGNNSQFGSLTPVCYGGGGGAIYGNTGNSGGSGGGGGWSGGSGGSGTSGQGHNGSSRYPGGGGGGGAGGDASGNDGGPGTSDYSSWALATSTGVLYSGSYYYAGGGGGEYSSNSTNGRVPGYTAGPANSGSGAGGNNSSNPSGGSGIVIVRYTRSQVGG